MTLSAIEDLKDIARRLNEIKLELVKPEPLVEKEEPTAQREIDWESLSCDGA